MATRLITRSWLPVRRMGQDALKLPESGPIGLEADRDQMEYRHIQIKELP